MLTYNEFLNLNNNIIEQNLTKYTNKELKLLSKYLKKFNNELFKLTKYQSIEYLLNDISEIIIMSYYEILIFCKDNNIKYLKYDKQLFKKDKKLIEKYLKKNNLFFTNNYCVIKIKDLYYLCIISIENRLEIINVNKNIFKIFPYLNNDLYYIKNEFSFSLGSERSEIKGYLKNNNIQFTQGYYEI